MTALPALDLSDPVQVWALGGAASVVLLLLLLMISVRRAGRAAREASTLAEQVARIGRTQAEMLGAQAQTAQLLDTRLSCLGADVGGALNDTATRTAETLGALQTRLAAIDAAQANIERLSGDVLGLQDILSNKQARGAFGEIQLHDLISRTLPPDSYRWQVTLSNGKRADCVIDLPDPPGPIVIDAKFPLEAYESLCAAENDSTKRAAARAFRTAIRAHIRAISEKYLVDGETADSALMFLPSEAVYAELHANYGDLVREGFAARVWTVSPTTCMAVLNTLRAVLKDVRLRQEAASIRSTLRLLHRDVELLSERAGKLRAHMAQVQTDLDGIETAAQRAKRRADQLETLEFDDGPKPARDLLILRN